MFQEVFVINFLAIFGCLALCMYLWIATMWLYDKVTTTIAAKRDNALQQENKHLHDQVHKLRMIIPADVDVPWIEKGED